MALGTGDGGHRDPQPFPGQHQLQYQLFYFYLGGNECFLTNSCPTLINRWYFLSHTSAQFRFNLQGQDGGFGLGTALMSPSSLTSSLCPLPTPGRCFARGTRAPCSG